MDCRRANYEDSRSNERRRGSEKHNEDDKNYRKHGEDVEEERGSRRHGKVDEERGSRETQRERHLDYKRARYDDSRSSERRRYENDRHNDGCSRHRD